MDEALTAPPSPKDAHARAVREQIEANLQAHALKKVYQVGSLPWAIAQFSVHPEHGYVSDVSADRARKKIESLLAALKHSARGS